MIKAVIFDFGRVISSQKPQRLFGNYEKQLGLAPESINEIMFDSQEWHDALLGRISETEFWHAIGPRLGLASPAKVEDFRRRYRADESINTGVENLIRNLHGRYKLAVLSNSPPGLSRWLRDWGIGDLFDVVFCSGDEGLTKPDPAAYQTVLDRLGVLPREAVFIDDTGGHVTAARKLGVHGIVFASVAQLQGALGALLPDDDPIKQKQFSTGRR